jgi:hypothetical protein
LREELFSGEVEVSFEALQAREPDDKVAIEKNEAWLSLNGFVEERRVTIIKRILTAAVIS